HGLAAPPSRRSSGLGGVAASHGSVGVTPPVQNRYGQPKWRGISEKSSEAVHRSESCDWLPKTSSKYGRTVRKSSGLLSVSSPRAEYSMVGSPVTPEARHSARMTRSMAL